MGFLYQFVKYAGKVALPLYFGKLEINGQEHIPKGHSYIIAPNHQSAFLDAILLGVYNRPPVHYLTRSDVFIKPFVGALTALNMMPVYRLRDGYEKLSKNEEVFSKCHRLLEEKIPVLIFPEGNMDDGHFLRTLTKGTSRMAIQSQEKLKNDLYVLPVGINYFHHDRPRYKCVLNFGPPLKVKDYMTLYQDHQAKGLIKLRNDLSDGIKDLLLIPDKENYHETVKALNRKNERYSFKALKAMIANTPHQTPRYYNHLKFIPALLSIFNPLTIWGVHYVLKSVITERQFFGSLKYILGLFLSLFWWTILFVGVHYFISTDVALLGVAISIIMLFIRSELKKYTDPI